MPESLSLHPRVALQEVDAKPFCRVLVNRMWPRILVTRTVSSVLEELPPLSRMLPWDTANYISL